MRAGVVWIKAEGGKVGRWDMRHETARHGDRSVTDGRVDNV